MKHLRNTFIVFSSTAINFFLAYLFHFLLGRLLGPSDYGLYGVVMNLAWITGIPLSIIGLTLVKYSSLFNARGDTKSLSGLIKSFTKFSLILNLLFSFVYILFSNQLSAMLGGDLSTLIILLAVSLPFSGVSGLFTNFAQGIGRVNLYSILNVLSNLFRLIIGYLLVIHGLGVNGALLSITLSGAGLIIIALPFIIKFFRIKSVRINIKELFSFGGAALLTNVFVNSIMQFDLLFVKSMISAESAGYYAAAVTLSKAFLMSSSVMAVFFPEFNKGNALSNKAKLRSDLKWALFYTGMICFIGLTGYLFFGDLIIRLTYSANYLSSLPVLKILSLGYVFYSLFNVLLNFIWAGNDKKSLIIVSSILFGLDLLGLFFFIPINGLIGAAWVTTIINLLLLISSLVIVFKQFY